MYASYFGLAKDPFNVAADAAFLFLSASHREALAGLQYGVLSRKGLIVITGDAGTGKSTLIARLRAYVSSDRLMVSAVSNPTVTPTEFFELLLTEFGVPNIPESKAQRLQLLQRLLLDAHAAGKSAALIVDEAHKLSRELLEEIRLLGNFDHQQHKLLQIVLAGQDELTEMLDRQDLRQLKQRIAVRLVVTPLDSGDVADYVQYRWIKAGGQSPHPFTTEAIRLVAQYSHGIPRLINTICDNSLLNAFSASSRSVVVPHVVEACTDLALLQPAPVMHITRPEPPLGTMEPLHAAAVTSRSVSIPQDGMVLGLVKRYDEDQQPRSFLARFAGKLGFAGQ